MSEDNRVANIPEPLQPPEKRYIGDSVYVEFDGFSIILTTNNGYPDDPRNRIALEPEVTRNLQGYIRSVERYVADWHKRNPS